MVVDKDEFIVQLRRAFADQVTPPEGRGARVLEVRGLEAPADDDDFGIEVTYRVDPDGGESLDRIQSIVEFMRSIDDHTPLGVAAFWQQELDETVLAG